MNGWCRATGRATSFKGAANRSAVGTLVDRISLFVMVVKMDACSVLAALDGFSRAFAPLDVSLCQTLTYDQGKEMALHAHASAERTGLEIYFADPHSPWQRGVDENADGLLRQYLPKGTNLSIYSQRDLDRIGLVARYPPANLSAFVLRLRSSASTVPTRGLNLTPLLHLALETGPPKRRRPPRYAAGFAGCPALLGWPGGKHKLGATPLKQCSPTAPGRPPLLGAARGGEVHRTESRTYFKSDGG